MSFLKVRVSKLAMFGAELKIEILIEGFDLFAHGCDDVEEAQVSDWSGNSHWEGCQRFV